MTKSDGFARGVDEKRENTLAHIFATCAWYLRPVGAHIAVSFCMFERFAEAKRQFWENKVRDPGLFEPFDNRNLQGPWNAHPRPSRTAIRDRY